MAEIIINDVKYTNVPNKKAGTKFASALTQSNIGMSQAVQDYVNSSYFYALINAIDINWDGIDIGENTYINTTSDLIKWIESKAGDIDLSSYATVSYVNQKFEDLIGGAPETLDTLKELADALQEDASLAYVTEALSGKADKTDLNDYATVAYVTTELDKKANVSDIPAAQDLSAYVTYTQANSYYAAKSDIPDMSNYLSYSDGNSYYVSKINSYIGHFDSTNAECTYIGKDTYDVEHKITKYNIAFGQSSTSKSNVFLLNNVQTGLDALICGNNLVLGGYGAEGYKGLRVSASDAFIFGQNINAYLWLNGASQYGYSNDKRNPVNNVVAIGHGLNVRNYGEAAFGIYNQPSESNYSEYAEDKLNTSASLFTVGNGKNDAPHNAISIRRNGQIWIADTYNGKPYILQTRLNSKADANNTYTKAEVDEKINAIDLSSYATNSQLDNRTLLVKDRTITTFGGHTLDDITEFDLKVKFNRDETLQINIHANNSDSNSVTLYLYADSDTETEHDESFEVTATYVGEDENFNHVWHVTCNAPIDSITFTNGDDPTSLGIEFEMSCGSSIITVIENFDNYATISYANQLGNTLDGIDSRITDIEDGWPHRYVSFEDLNNLSYLSYSQANSYYAAKSDITNLEDSIWNVRQDMEDNYTTYAYVTSELENKVDLESFQNLNYYVYDNCVTYSSANTYYAYKSEIPDMSNYVDINSYNALYHKCNQLDSEIQHLAYLISYYHPSTPDPGPGPTPGGQTNGYWTYNGMNYYDSITLSQSDSHIVLEFVGTPSVQSAPAGTWSFTDPQATGIMVASVTGNIDINLSSATPGTFTVTASYPGDATYNSYTKTFTINIEGSSKQHPSGYWTENGVQKSEIYVTAGDTTTKTLTFNGTPSKFWAVRADPGVSGITINSSLDVIINPTNMMAGTYVVEVERAEDISYYSGSASINIYVLPVGTDPDLFYRESSVTLNNNMMSQTPMLINNTGETVTYASSDTNICTVDSMGMITYVAPGNATVTATAGNHTATISVICETSKMYPNANWTDGQSGVMNNQFDAFYNDGVGQKTFTFSGNPSDSWKFEGSGPGTSNNYVTLDSATGTITVNDLDNINDTLDYSVNATRQEDSQYFSGNGWFNVVLHKYQDRPEFYPPNVHYYLNNDMMTTNIMMNISSTAINRTEYVSNDSSVCTVDSTGMITYVGAGNTTITCNAYDVNDQLLYSTYVYVICDSVTPTPTPEYTNVSIRYNAGDAQNLPQGTFDTNPFELGNGDIHTVIEFAGPEYDINNFNTDFVLTRDTSYPGNYTTVDIPQYKGYDSGEISYSYSNGVNTLTFEISIYAWQGGDSSTPPGTNRDVLTFTHNGVNYITDGIKTYNTGEAT